MTGITIFGIKMIQTKNEFGFVAELARVECGCALAK